MDRAGIEKKNPRRLNWVRLDHDLFYYQFACHYEFKVHQDKSTLFSLVVLELSKF